MQDDMIDSVKETSTWYRGLYMLLFAIIYSIAELMVILVAVFQFVATLFTGRPMERVLDFGDDLSIYVYEILQYVTFNSDEKPFPFGPWPTEGNRPVLDYDATDVTDEPEEANSDASPEAPTPEEQAPQKNVVTIHSEEDGEPDRFTG